MTQSTGVEVWADQAAGTWRWRAYCNGTMREGTGTSELNCQTQAQNARSALLMEARLLRNNRST